MEKTEISLNHSPLTAFFMPRPRIDQIFDRATRCKLVYVIAGAGYGKTQAVHHYIKQQPDAVVRWLQLSESDNVGARYWEHLVHNINHDNPDLADKLREFGFPETIARFKQFAEILKTSEHQARKAFLVLDDFHLISNRQALVFAERCAYLQIPGACVIIISRKEPEINAIPLFSKGKACIITEDELRFTEEEMTEFFKLRSIPYSLNDIPRLHDATKGWALAINLLSLVMSRVPKNIDHALDTMKQNIFKLLEIEAFNDFPESIKKSVVKFSLVSDLPLVPLHKITEDISLLTNTKQLSSFMWFDSLIGDYRIHPLYMEFLQSKHHILSDSEMQSTYSWAAEWCSENNFYMDAMKYYKKSRQNVRMLETLLSYPFRLPYDTCEYFLRILEDLSPDDDNRTGQHAGGHTNQQTSADQSTLLLKYLFVPLLYIGMGRFDDAAKQSYDIIERWEQIDTPFSKYLLYTAYSNLAYIDTYTCTITHTYEFTKHLKKALEYYRQSSIPPVDVSGPFAVADVRSFACLVGEGAELTEFDRFLETVKEAAVYISETYHHLYYGYDDLVACELAFNKNQPEIARNFAHNAILRAREKKQYSIEVMAEQILLRIAVLEGDHPLANEILKQFRDHLENPDFWNRRLLHDMYTGFFYIQIGLPEMAPSWFVIDEKDTDSEIHIPSRELIVTVKYHIARKKYKQALTVLSNSYPREPHERFALGELTLYLLTAVAKLKTGDPAGAANDFIKAYKLSYNGIFEMPFIELGKELQPLLNATPLSGDTTSGDYTSGDVTSRDGISGDQFPPEEWRKMISKKASIYAKKAAVIMNAMKKDKRHTNPVSLSERELEVLKDLYHGLSREELALNQNLSINTINKVLQSIFIKLDANNSVDVIRIAVERKLID